MQAQQSGGGAASSSGVLKDSSFLSHLDPRLAKPFLEGFSDSIDLVFLVGAGVMVFGFLVMLFLPARGAALRLGLLRARPGRCRSRGSGRRRQADASNAGACTPRL